MKTLVRFGTALSVTLAFLHSSLSAQNVASYDELYEAVATNNAGAGGAIINLTQSIVIGADGLYVDRTLPDHLKDLTIQGSEDLPLVLSGNGKSQIFYSDNQPVPPTLTLSNLIIENGADSPSVHQWDGGGAIYNQGGDLFISSVVFRNNKATFGGAINHWNGYGKPGGLVDIPGTATLDNVLFENNQATVSGGGAIFNDNVGTSMTLNDSVFRGNIAKGYGGAIYNKDQAELVINVSEGQDLSYTGNAAYRSGSVANASGGGFLYMHSGSATFNVNGMLSIGGADSFANATDSIAGNSSATITKTGTGTLVLNGDNRHYQGAFAFREGTLSIARAENLLGGVLGQVSFSGSASLASILFTGDIDLDGNGSYAAQRVVMGADINAAYMTADGVVVRIHNNKPVSENGAVLENSGTFAFGGSGTFVLENNQAVDGGVIFNSGVVSVASAEFTKNRATNNGGAMYNSGTASIAGGIFLSNTAANGGAIYSSGSVTAENVSFTGNYASDNGGAVYNLGAASISGASFEGNRASDGGAIYNTGTISMTDVTFENNRAGLGGAIMSVGAGSTVIIENGLIASNTSSGNGGGGAFQDITLLQFTNVSFEGNNASNYGGGLIYTSYESDTEQMNAVFTNVSFVGNRASALGGGMLVGMETGGDTHGYMTLNTDLGQTNLYSANTDRNGANAIALLGGNNDAVTLRVTGEGILDMRDPLSTYWYGTAFIVKDNWTNPNTNETINGGGTWKLGGESVFGRDGDISTIVSINTGTLYLYRAGEVENSSTYNSLTAGQMVEAGGLTYVGNGLGTFTLGADATLVAAGDNWIDVGTGNLNSTITLADGATFAFDLTNATDDGGVEGDNAMLTLAGQNLATPGALNFNLLSLNANAGSYTLINAASIVSGTFTAENLRYTYLGEDMTTLGSNRLILSLNDDANIISLFQGPVRLALTWTGSGAANADGSYNWNMTDANWTDGGSITQYLPEDSVTFDSMADNGGVESSARRNIVITSSYGVQVEDMTVSGSGSYAFASASGVTNGITVTETLLKQGTGTLDLTGITGTNDFQNGLVLEGGGVRLSKVAQIGKLSNVYFTGTDGSAAIIFAASATFDGGSVNAGDSDHDQRVSVYSGYTGGFVAEQGTVVTIQNNRGAFEGSAIYNSGSFAIRGSGTMHFTKNAATYGGAIGNESGGQMELQNVVFSLNEASNNGGAIENYGGSKLGIKNALFVSNTAGGNGGALANWSGSATANISDAIFASNVAYNGGAVANWSNATATVVDTVFVSNTAQNYGGALYNDSTSKLTLDVSAGRTVTHAGNIALGGGVNGTASAGGFLYMTGGTATLNITGVMNIGDASSFASGADSIAGVASSVITKSGAGTLVLNGDNRYYAGSFNLANGTLAINRAENLLGGEAGKVNVAGTATLRADGDVELTGELALGGPLTLATASGKVLTYSGTATGTGAVTIDGSVVYAKAQTYTGQTTVRRGELSATGANYFSRNSKHVIDSQGVLNLGGFNQTFGNLQNDGLVKFASASGSAVLTTGSLSGNGAYQMKVNLNTLTSDRIVVTGQAQGTHTLSLTGAGTPTVDLASVSIPVVSYASGNALFTGNSVTAGMNEYELRNVAQGAINLVYSGRSAAADAILATAGVAAADWMYSLDSLRLRMGELRSEGSQPVGRENTGSVTGNVWVRGNAYHVEGGNELGGNGFDQNTYGVTAGLDCAFPINQAVLYAGGFLSMGRSDRDYVNYGDGKTNTLGIGVYGTWLHDAGWYVDGVIRADNYENEIKARASDGILTNADYDNRLFGMSVEFGRRLQKNQYWVEPSAQLAIAYINGADYTTTNNRADADNIDVSINRTTAYQYRMQLRAGVDLGRWHPYGKVGAARVETDNGKIVANGSPYQPTFDGWRFEAGAGVACRIDEVSQLYFDYEYNKADAYERPWAISLGYRRAW